MRFGKQDSVITYMEPQLKRELERVAKRQRTSRAALLREGAMLVLQKYASRSTRREA